jgi:hypothetical protein
MQKPMLGDASGLTATMWDPIADALGTVGISVFGGWNMKHTSTRSSTSTSGIDRFIEGNPCMFRR